MNLKEIFLIYRADNDGGRPFNIKARPSVKSKEKPMPGKDVALLKTGQCKQPPTLRVCRVGDRMGRWSMVIGAGYRQRIFWLRSTSQPTLRRGSSAR